MRVKLLAAGGLLALTLLSYFQYPGHIYLQSDTQIYVPMFERFRDPGLFERDPMVVRPHTAFTLYDELTLAMSRWTGLGFEGALGILHVATRVALLTGIFLIARAMGLSAALALACAGVYALGGTVRGPSVLLVEYEPVPRALALGCSVLALGLAAQRRYLASGVAGAAGFLLHATTVGPFWAAFIALMFIPDEPEEMKARLKSLAPLAVAAAILKAASSLQAGVTEPQALLATIDPAWEQILRTRASYVFVEMWPQIYFWQYALMLVVAAAAFWRLRVFIQPELRFLAVVLTGLGVLSLPASYVLLEKMKWAMTPQIQPLRTILFLEMFALLLALVMAFELACREKRPLPACLWAAVALAIGVDPRLLFALAPPAVALLWGGRVGLIGAAVGAAAVAARPFGIALWKGEFPTELVVVLSLGALFVVAARTYVRRGAPGVAAVFAVALLGFYLVPGRLRLHWSGETRNPELVALSDWARARTDRNAVFLFADADRSSEPGIFRVHAERALYVDWKGGGQSNFFHDFARLWWSRWQQTMATRFTSDKLARFRELGIDYVVLGARTRLPDRPAEFANAKYNVYRLK